MKKQVVVITRDKTGTSWVLSGLQNVGLSELQYNELKRIGALELYCFKSGLCLVRMDIVWKMKHSLETTLNSSFGSLN